VSPPSFSKFFYGSEEHPRADGCAYNEVRAKRSEDAGSRNSKAISVTEDKAPRSSVGNAPRRVPKRGVLVCVAIAMGLLLAAVAGPAAQASTPIYSFTTQPGTTAAGAHPDVKFSFTLGSSEETSPSPCSCSADAKDVSVHLPTGLIGNPHSTPQCTIAQFASHRCPIDSQLGIAQANFANTPPGAEGGFVAPVYNLIPPPEEPALLAFESTFSTPILINVSARTDSDYGIDAVVSDINHFVPLHKSETVIWGVPAAPIHDYLRFNVGQQVPLSGGQELCDSDGRPSTEDPTTVFQLCKNEQGQPGPAGELAGGTGGPIPSSSPETPFFQNPTTCGETSLTTSLDILSYDRGQTHAESPYPPTTDCPRLSFNPSQSIEPTTAAADSPSGAEFRLTVPQFENPTVPSPSELRAALVTLPPGFSFAPNVTNGKQTCSDAQARFGTTEAARCPEDSKIGTLAVETPVLPGLLPGAVYLGEPKPGNRFRLILAFDGFGVHVKLAGSAVLDPQTGQIRISFQDLPQAPFAEFNMHIFGSERGPLDTPARCGTYEVQSEFDPWDAALPNVISRQFFHITEGPNGTPCPAKERPFAPGFQAASASNAAGAHTSFSFDLTRQDGEQNLSALDLTTPPGFTATLKGLTYCPDAAIAAAASQSHTGLAEQASPSCPASSQVGEFTTGAGPGSHPLYLPGKVYLAGPYQGAPLSFVFITPAVSAGYDLGNVVVREGLDINPETAQVSTAGAPLPQIFEGIPLRLRQIMVDLNRPGFALNPTDCDPFSVSARVFGDEAAVSSSSAHFQVANCASLPFAPKLSLKLTGSTRQAGNPALTATLTARPGEANISRARVTLPPTELIDNAHINSPCTRVQFNQGVTPGEKCPPGSVLGFARANTPLLEKPLEGPIYLRTTGRAGLPDIVAALNGQIDIVLDGHVDSVHGSLRTTFESVPDAPVTKVVLSFDGGHKGLIENSPQLCAHTQHFTAALTGQNGKMVNRSPILSTSCGKKQKRKVRVRRHRGVRR
jgi:hypothetical protein